MDILVANIHWKMLDFRTDRHEASTFFERGYEAEESRTSLATL